MLSRAFQPPKIYERNQKVTASERSASQIYRLTEGLWRAVEGPRRCLLADALQSFPVIKIMKEIKKVTTSERSASQIYRLTEGFWRVAEGTPTMVVADALQSFPAPKPERNQKSHSL